MICRNPARETLDSNVAPCIVDSEDSLLASALEICRIALALCGMMVAPTIVLTSNVRRNCYPATPPFGDPI
jgi:hypothetical protein